MDNSALTDFPELNAEPIQAIEETVVTAAEDSERELGSLLAHKGFQRLAKMMQADIDALKTHKHADFAGLDLAKVGEKVLVELLVAAHAEKYLSIVNNAAKAVADAERAKQPK